MFRNIKPRGETRPNRVGARQLYVHPIRYEKGAAHESLTNVTSHHLESMMR